MISNDLELNEIIHCHTVPSPTANIIVTDITSRTALITWVEPATPNGVITGYTLTLTFNTGSVINDTVDIMFSAVDLRPFTEYTVSVQGITGGGTGESGQGFTFTTLEDSESVNVWKSSYADRYLGFVMTSCCIFLSSSSYSCAST